jgi:hypothetical protein
MKKKSFWLHPNPCAANASVQNNAPIAIGHPYTLSEAELHCVSGGGGHAGGVADAAPTITTMSVTTAGGTAV